MRVAATVDEVDGAEERDVHACSTPTASPPEDRLVRGVARTGFADWRAELALENR